MDEALNNAPTPPVELGLFEISTNLALSIVLGLIVAMVYRQTHKGLSYSQSFTLTIIFVTVIVAIVMMVIENSIARAFALVGALSIIRFRTVVKDTKDTAFVFLGLAVGMAAGTSNYLLGGLGTAVVCILAIVLHRTNFGALYKSEFILRFRYDKDSDSAAYLAAIQQNARRSNMLHIEPSGDGSSLLLTYDIELMEGQAAEELASALGVLKGITEVTLIASKNDVDY